MANADLDRQFSLGTIGYLKSWDNVDGIFAETIDRAYREYFLVRPRYVVQDLSRANDVLSRSKLSYGKVIEDAEVLGQLSRSMKVETVLRTRIVKEGPKYKFDVEWLHAPKMEVIASQAFEVVEPPPGEKMKLEAMREALEKALDALLAKVPFVGQVNGRDGESVTLSLGRKGGLKRGDTLDIATLEEVKKHPLLNRVVDWKLEAVGKVVVEEVDENISFGKVKQEAEGRQIGRFQKIVHIEPMPEPDPKKGAPENGGKGTGSGAASWVAAGDVTEVQRTAEDKNMPRYGWVSASAQMGKYSREFSSGAGTAGFAGSGFFFGGKLDGSVWFTRNFFADWGLGYGTASVGQSDLLTGVESTSTLRMNLFSFHLAPGLTLFFTDDILGPKGWVKVGFMRNSYGMTLSVADLAGTTNFNSFTVGLGADLPIRKGFGAQLDFNFGVVHIVKAATDLAAGSASGPSAVTFYIGGYYRLLPKLMIRSGVEFKANGTDFTIGSLSHRVVSFAPSLLYFF